MVEMKKMMTQQYNHMCTVSLNYLFSMDVSCGVRVVVPTNSGVSKVGHSRAFALTTAADSFFSKLQYCF